MGGGVAGWLTPGWMINDRTLAPHVKEPMYVKTMLKEGEDPKPALMDECKPQCLAWKGKLERCESKLALVVKVDPTKTCMYPMRDYVNCVEACVQPLIHNNLKGTE